MTILLEAAKECRDMRDACIDAGDFDSARWWNERADAILQAIQARDERRKWGASVN